MWQDEVRMDGEQERQRNLRHLSNRKKSNKIAWNGMRPQMVERERKTCAGIESNNVFW